ncbi:MAG: peptide deformylase [Geobacteraceae bacterium]
MPILRQIAQLGNPVLRQLAQTVPDIAHPSVQSLIDDMLATVAEANGVGIAAPHVYEPLRIFVIASRPNSRYPNAPALEPTALLNPELSWASDEKEKGWEGCLSIPGIRGFVPRSRKIGIKYLTRAGVRREEEFSDFLARIFQHEFDHLNATVFLDRVESTQELICEKEFLRMLNSPD